MTRLSSCIMAAAAATVLVFGAPAAFAQALTVNSEQAMAAMDAALKYAKKDGSDVTVVVLDRDGKVVMMMRGNNAAPHNLDLARRKAFTAFTVKTTTLDWRLKSTPEQLQAMEQQSPDIIPLGGGVPIMAGGEVIGAVGASGTKGGQEGDTAAARAAAEAAEALVKRLQASN